MSQDKGKRKKAAEAASPESLTEYIRVTDPGAWLLVAAVTLLLIGAIVWGCTGRLETTAAAVAVCHGNGEATLYMKETEIASVSLGDPVRVSGTEAVVTSLSASPVAADQVLEEYALYLGGFRAGEWVYPVTVKIDPGESPEGVYPAEIVTDSVSPISFLLN